MPGKLRVTVTMTTRSDVPDDLAEWLTEGLVDYEASASASGRQVSVALTLRSQSAEDAAEQAHGVVRGALLVFGIEADQSSRSSARQHAE